MRITKEIYSQIVGSYAPAPPESGGILGERGGIICAYAHDGGRQTELAAIYEPNVVLLNGQINLWSERGIAFAGIIHSHPSGQQTLSGSDIEYALRLLNANKQLERLYFPVIIPGEGIYAYTVSAENSGSVCAEELQLVQRDDGGFLS